MDMQLGLHLTVPHDTSKAEVLLPHVVLVVPQSDVDFIHRRPDLSFKISQG